MKGQNAKIEDPSYVAERISKTAEEKSYQKNYMSPFAKGAREHNYNYIGGKPDDITVVVAQIRLKNTKTDKKHQ